MSDCDIIVLGSGAAGMTAALAAHEAGAHVRLIERFDRVGGTSAVSGGVIWVADNPRMRAAGKPLPGVELKVVDEEGNEVPTGEVGEIITRSSNNMISYWNLPEATAKTLSADGWVRTGDAGYMDEDGYLFIHDRVKDMIISGGENVYPAEVESAIYGHPAIAEVAVIGIPDDKSGEVVKVYVVKKDQALTEKEVIEHCKKNLTGYKVPKFVEFRAELPKTNVGKILRRALRDEELAKTKTPA